MRPFIRHGFITRVDKRIYQNRCDCFAALAFTLCKTACFVYVVGGGGIHVLLDEMTSSRRALSSSSRCVATLWRQQVAGVEQTPVDMLRACSHPLPDVCVYVSCNV